MRVFRVKMELQAENCTPKALQALQGLQPKDKKVVKKTPIEDSLFRLQRL